MIRNIRSSFCCLFLCQIPVVLRVFRLGASFVCVIVKVRPSRWGTAVVADVISTHNCFIVRGHMETDMRGSVLLPH